MFCLAQKLNPLEIGKVNLKDSYANIKNGELYIYGLHISPYEFGNIYNKDPLRDRKLLVNKREINKFLEDYYTKYTGLYLKSKDFLSQIK